MNEDLHQFEIKRAFAEQAPMLADLAIRTFIESHGHSATKENIDEYIQKTYTQSTLAKELNDPGNIYHLIYYNETPVGFSKIILNSPHKEIASPNITKMDRLYILKKFNGMRIGAKLMQFNIDLSKENQQDGMWLHTWKENERAICFYQRSGFTIIGEADFRLTPTHVNPNYLMYLQY